MARLWQAERDAVILSDDRVVLRGEADGLWMYGTPWHGEEPLASPERARLAAVFFLRQHERHEVAPVARVDGVARLFAASFPPFHNAPALDFTLGFIDSIVERVPASSCDSRPAQPCSISSAGTCRSPLIESAPARTVAGDRRQSSSSTCSPLSRSVSGDYVSDNAPRVLSTRRRVSPEKHAMASARLLRSRQAGRARITVSCARPPYAFT